MARFRRTDPPPVSFALISTLVLSSRGSSTGSSIGGNVEVKVEVGLRRRRCGIRRRGRGDRRIGGRVLDRGPERSVDGLTVDRHRGHVAGSGLGQECRVGDGDTGRGHRREEQERVPDEQADEDRGPQPAREAAGAGGLARPQRLLVVSLRCWRCRCVGRPAHDTDNDTLGVRPRKWAPIVNTLDKRTIASVSSHRRLRPPAEDGTPTISRHAAEPPNRSSIEPAAGDEHDRLDAGPDLPIETDQLYLLSARVVIRPTTVAVALGRRRRVARDTGRLETSHDPIVGSPVRDAANGHGSGRFACLAPPPTGRSSASDVQWTAWPSKLSTTWSSDTAIMSALVSAPSASASGSWRRPSFPPGSGTTTSSASRTGSMARSTRPSCTVKRRWMAGPSRPDPFGVPDRRRYRVAPVRLPGPARGLPACSRADARRDPALPAAGGTRDRIDEQDPGVRAPGPRPGHGRGEHRSRLPGRRARLLDRGAHAAIARCPVRAPDDEQPTEDRRSACAGRRGRRSDPAGDPGECLRPARTSRRKPARADT